LEPADIFVPETVCGELMSLGAERAHQIAMDMCDDSRYREGRPHPVLAQYLSQPTEPLIGAEQRLGRREVGGGNALRPRGDAQIDSDRDAATGVIRPANLRIREAPFVGDRVTLLPWHRRPPVFRARPRAADGGRCSS